MKAAQLVMGSVRCLDGDGYAAAKSAPGGCAVIANRSWKAIRLGVSICWAVAFLAGCGSNGDATPVDSCDEAQVMCQETCIDPATNATYCGATGDCTGANAGIECTEGESCVEGVCTPPVSYCETDQVLCDEACIDPATHPTYCGASGDCTGDNAGTSCTESEDCVAGVCKTEEEECDTGWVRCDGTCIDPNTDATYCGASEDCTADTAGIPCTDNETCVQGLCTLPPCEDDLVRCDGTCIDPNTDSMFCGASGGCEGSDHGEVCAEGQSCVGGVCLSPCEGESIRCNGTCIDPNTDATYCGASGDCTGANAGEACLDGATCTDGLCKSLPTGVCGTDMKTGDTAYDDCLETCCAPFLACTDDAACAECLQATPPDVSCTENALIISLQECLGPCLDTSSDFCDSGMSTGDVVTDECINTSCCEQFNLCNGDATCASCILDPMSAGCDTNAVAAAFWTCADPCLKPGSSICGSDGTFGDPAVDECLTASCCEPFNTCYNDATCLDCLTGMGTGCDSNSDLNAFMACAEPCMI